jgi:hypothetical protein
VQDGALASFPDAVAAQGTVVAVVKTDDSN